MVGLKGDIGLPGEPGSAGQLVEIKGARGQKGEQGLFTLLDLELQFSALKMYEALIKINVQFLGLVGLPGIDGEKGDRGAPGYDGLKGERGAPGILMATFKSTKRFFLTSFPTNISIFFCFTI